MELVELYNKALKLVEEVKNFRSQTAEEKDASLCIIVSDSDKIYAGVTGIRISGENVMTACSEYNALMSMIADGSVSVKQMMTVSFADGTICRPCSECIDMLYKADENNTQCEIALSAYKAVKACELDNAEMTAEFEFSAEEPETPHSPIEEVPSFSAEPVSDSFSFEEKFGFDFDDTPSEITTPVQTLANQNQEPQTVPMPEQPQNVMPQGMNPQFIQPDNMQNYTQSQGYPYSQPAYPQSYPYPQPVYPQGYPYPQQNGMNPQFVQPDNMQNYTQSQNYPQYAQPVNQGSFPYNPQPYPQNTVQSQPLQSVSPHQSAPYVSSRYINSMGSGSVPTGSVPLSGEGKSKFRQRLSKFVGEDNPVVSATPASTPAEESLSKAELKKIARDKKKMAKVNADFKKRMKDLGY
ncbi:MAG: hypothetical protein K2J32_13400 [Ruminococcus sp.]|nr:hypothetical protein [Ruminococcus sp.]